MKYLAVSLSLAVLILGCENPSLGDEVITGDENDMFVNSYDELLTLENTDLLEIENEIDVDGDNVNDFKLILSYKLGIGTMPNPISTITCLHSASVILGYKENDTIYHCLPVIPDMTEYYTCNDFSFDPGLTCEVDEVFIDEPKLEVKLENEIIRLKDSFIYDSFTVFSLHSVEKSCRDCNSVYWNYTCDDVPVNQIIYLGIQITSNGIKRLGWIKLYAPDRNRILLISSGIQVYS